MAHDAEALASRLRAALKGRRSLAERRMFGGVCFLVRGNMLCGVHEDRLMFRVGKAQDRKALARPGARPMDFTGRRYAGFVWVDPERCDARALKRWVAMAASYVASLPSKQA